MDYNEYQKIKEAISDIEELKKLFVDSQGVLDMYEPILKALNEKLVNE